MTADPEPEAAPTPEPMAGPDPRAAAPAGGAEVPLQIRVQMMATEHWSLLASRNLAWTESFTRASMFLSTLSFAIVALALVGQATAFGEEFRIFALVVLPVVLFLGIATVLRLDSANNHDAQCVIGMNRIRAGYLEIAPDLERFFVMGTSDDLDGIMRTMSLPPNRSFFANLVSANPMLVAVLNAVLLGAIAGIGVVQLGAGSGVAVAVAALAFLVALAAWIFTSQRLVRGVMAAHRPVFPSRPELDPPG